MSNLPEETFSKKNLPNVIRKIIEKYIENHKLSLSAHEEIMSMTHSDKDVAYYFYKRELDLTYKMSEMFKNNGFDIKNLDEKVHVIIGLIDTLCHEIVYHKHENLNYDAMINVVVNSIIDILK